MAQNSGPKILSLMIVAGIIIVSFFVTLHDISQAQQHLVYFNHVYSIKYNESQSDVNLSIYGNVISAYINTLRNMVQNKPLSTSKTNIAQDNILDQCLFQKPSKDDLDPKNIDEYISKNYINPMLPNKDCSRANAENLYKYPDFDPKELYKDQKYIQQLETIQNDLKYLVVSHHGGTNVDTISYLHNALGVTNKNIINVCSGSYCPKTPRTGSISKFRYYMEYINEPKSRKYQNVITKKDILNACCWKSSYSLWRNVTNINRIHKRISAGIKKKVDVLICDLPSMQCAFLLPFAKVIIIRFMHRFNHHLYNESSYKWAKVIHSISKYCSNKNMILTASNAYDWFYTVTLTNIPNLSKFYLWPNFARHFVDDFGINLIHTHEKRTTAKKYLLYWQLQDLESSMDCQQLLNATDLSSKLKTTYEIDLLSDVDMFKPLMYNVSTLHFDISGIIVIPYSVHAAKWIEFYSIGMQLFMPTIEFWLEMNDKCQVIQHRQARNKPHYEQMVNLYGYREYMKYGVCGKYNPFQSKYQETWIPFSDYYMNTYFLKYIIFYNSSENLIEQVIAYDKLSLEERWKKKTKQVQEFTLLSQKFKPHLVHAIYSAYEESQSQCNLKINDLVSCLIQKNW